VHIVCREHFGIDVNPERVPVLEAIKVNARVVQIFDARWSMTA
jgi:hypothetical protein